MKHRYPIALLIVLVSILTRQYYLMVLVVPLGLLRTKTNFMREVQPNKLRVLSYNVFMRPGLWFIKHSVSDYKNQRLQRFLSDFVQRYDVMALQELFSLFTLRQSHLLDESYQYSAVTGMARYLFWNRHWRLQIPFLDAGVVTVSKYPITATDSHTYTRGNQIDGWVPKQVIWTLVKLPNDRFINIFNTHLQATHTHLPNTSSSDAIRNKQVEELADFVHSKTQTYKFPSLLCGDFNLDSLMFPLDYARMMDIFKKRLEDPERGYQVKDVLPGHPVTFGCPGETTLTHPSDVDSKMCLDYIFYVGPPDFCTIDAHVEPFKVDGEPFTQLSDHFGVVCTLDFSNPNKA